MIHKARRSRRRQLVVSTFVLLLTVGAAYGYWTAISNPGGGGAAAATTVNAGNTPTVSATGSAVTVTWSASTIATGSAVTGYRITRYDQATHTAQTMLSACNGVVAGTSCTESAVPPGTWRYTVTPLVASNWRGAESADSSSVTVDTTPPTNVLSVSAPGGNAALNSATVYYRGVEAGSLRVTNSLTDAGSGPASSATAALGGTSTGWSHTASTVSTPSGGPYVSNSFSWTAGTSSAPTEVVTGRDVAGNFATTTLSFVNDSTAPAAGTISYADGYQSGRSVTVTFTTGTDTGSGVATRQLQRASAALTSGTCGTFGSFGDLGTAGPTSPYADTTVASGACYKYRYVVTDAVGNQDIATSANVAKIDYAGAVNTNAQGQWRLGQSLFASDSFTGTSGTALTSHAPEIGSTWSTTGGLATEQISSVGRAYKSGTLGGIAVLSATSPTSSDYAVESDIYVRSVVNGDFAGVMARQDNGGLAAAARYYAAGFRKSPTGGAGTWVIIKNDGIVTPATLGTTSAATLASSTSYRVRLEITGTTLKLYADGVLKVTTTDSTLAAAGKAGIVSGDPRSATPPATSDTTGMHLDNFLVTPRAADSKGTNTGDHYSGVVLGQTGALGSDTNTAALYDGANDYTTIARQISDDFTIEFWFSSTQGRGTGADWWSGAGMVDAEVSGAANDFGVSLRSDGKVVAGVGTPDVSVVSSSGGYNNGAWHLVTFTRVKSTGALNLYVDGALAGTATGSTASLTSSSTIYFGRLASSTTQNYAGKLDEVATYTSPLDAAAILAHYQLGSASAPDLTGPTGGSVDATGLTGTGSRHSTSTTLSLALAKGTDPSGIATSGNLLKRATATLASGTCGTFGSYVLVSGGTDPVSPKSDTVEDQACYRYQYSVADTVGNWTTYTSPDIKVDTGTPSTPALSFSAMTNAYWSGGASTSVYYRSAAAASFTATASSSSSSGIASYAYPALGTGWSSTAGTLGVNTYSWTASPAAPGTKNVTATSNSGAVSASSPFTMVGDDTAPTAGSVSYVNGSTIGSTASVSFTTGTDSGSGVGTRLLQRASAPFTGITCGTFGSFTTITGGTNPTSPVSDSVTAGNCYKYQYVVSDNVGNQHIASSTDVAHTPFGGIWRLDAGSGFSAVDSSGNGNTATLQSGALWTSPGKVGASSLNLSGATTSWASAPTAVDTSDSYSVAAWVRPTNVTGFRTFVAIDGVNISPFYLQMDAGVLKFTQRTTDSISTSAAVSVNGPTAAVNTWYHLVGVHDKTNQVMRFYVNGVLQGTTPYTSAWKATGTTTIGRGKWNGAGVDFVQGNIDEVRFYDKVLTQAEITALQ